MTPKEILAKWDHAVWAERRRSSAFTDPTVSANEYGHLSQASMDANVAAVEALGGFSRFSMPMLTAWAGAR